LIAFGSYVVGLNLLDVVDALLALGDLVRFCWSVYYSLFVVNTKKIKLLIIQKLPLDRTNPPRTMTRSNPKEPNVFAIVISLPKAAMNRNSPAAIWLTHTSRRYCLQNLPLRKFIIFCCPKCEA
jgi:hypothetical protein